MYSSESLGLYPTSGTMGAAEKERVWEKVERWGWRREKEREIEIKREIDRERDKDMDKEN